MKLTVQLQLHVTSEQGDALLDTMRTANAACDWVSARAWKSGEFKQYDIHRESYYAAREQFPRLASQMIVRVEAKVSDAYKLDKNRKRKFRPLGAIAYDDRILSFKVDASTVSIWTTAGRQKMPFVCGDKQRELLAYERGESDLVHRDGRFYLLVTVDIPDAKEREITGFIGVDLGIVHIATDSDGSHYDNPKIEAIRVRRASHRTRLGNATGDRQRAGKRPRSIRRAIARHNGKERRFRTDVNHCIAKQIVTKAQDTARGISIEDLTGIRPRTEKRLRRPQRSRHSSWAFAQLRTFLTYKAELAGVPLLAVDARNTSRTCHLCGHCDKGNRKSQAEFECKACGYSANADFNAAVNIAARAAVNRPDLVSETHRESLGV